MITLQATKSEDLNFVLAAEQAAHQQDFVRLWSRDRHVQACHDPDERHWIVTDATQQERVGYVIMQGIHDPDQSVLIKRIVITQPGQGYGKAALQTVLQQAFFEFNAHRVWLDVMDFNDRARSLYRRVGFVEEGKLRESVKVSHGFASQWIMSILRSEYLATQSPP